MSAEKKYSIRLIVSVLSIAVCVVVAGVCGWGGYWGARLLKVQKKMAYAFNSENEMQEVQQGLQCPKVLEFVFRHRWGELQPLENLKKTYEKKSKEYFRKKNEKTLRNELQEKIKKITQAKNLTQAAANLKSEIEIYQFYLEKCSEAKDLLSEINMKLKDAKEKFKNIGAAEKCQDKINELLDDSKELLSDRKVGGIRLFLNDVDKFEKQYPQKQAHELLQSKYRLLLKEKRKWCKHLRDEMEKELEPYAEIPENIVEKRDTYKKCLAICRKYERLCSQNCEYCREVQDKSKHYLQKKNEFEIKVIEQNAREIFYEGKNSQYKLGEIERLKRQLSDSETSLASPQYNDAIQSLDGMIKTLKKAIEKEKKWANFLAKIDALKTSEPSGIEYEKVDKHLQKCREAEQELQRLKKEEIASSEKIKQAQERLTALIRKYRSILAIINCVEKIKNNLESFKNNRSKDTFNALKNAIDELGKRKVVRERDKNIVNAARNVINGMEKAEKELRDKCNKFKEDKTVDAFTELKRVVTQYKEKVLPGNNIVSFVSEVSSALKITYKVNIENFDFSSDKYFESKASTGDSDLFITLKGDYGGDIGLLKASKKLSGGMQESYWASTPIGGSLRLEVINKNGNWGPQEGTIKFVEILAEGIDNGEYEKVLTISHGGKVCIKFSGLPSVIRKR